MKKKYSITELLALNLQSLPSSRQNITQKAMREGWPFVEVPGGGGPGGVRREFEVPAYVRAEIAGKAEVTRMLEDKEAMDAVDGLLASAESAPKEDTVKMIVAGQVIEDQRIWHICTSIVRAYKEMHQVNLKPQREIRFAMLIYDFMMLRKDMGQPATVEELADTVEFMMPSTKGK
ncbi:MAG: hypothetical protein NT086_02100 [Proteobacteria bacterium]|nr:hypothetical protein [Pseudomonadota bacterium]